MTKKTKSPTSELKNNEIEGSCASLILPALKLKTEVSCSQSPEDAEYSAGWEKAVKKSPIIDDINWVESQKPKNIDEMIQKRNLLNNLHVELAKIDGDETEVDTEKTEKADDFICNLKVEYSTDTSVILTQKGEHSQECSCQKMGFKSTAKTWTMFIDLLRSDDPVYTLPIYSKNRNNVENRAYNNSLQTLRNFSKKFIVFLNNTYSAQIPGNLMVFENQKGVERAGTYRPMFHVIRPVTDRQISIQAMTKNELLKELDTLAEKRRREKDPYKKEQLLIEIGRYIELGKKNSWINLIQATRYVPIDDESPSSDDLLANASPLPGNIS